MARCSRPNGSHRCTCSLRLFLCLSSYYIMHTTFRNKKILIKSEKNKTTTKVWNLSLNRRPRPSLRHIPESLITQVLARLPAKSLLRFRPVCKLWNSLTRDPHFVDRHTELNCKKPSSTLIIDYYKDWPNDYLYNLDCYGGDCRQLIHPKRKFSMLLDFPPLSNFHMFSNACDGLICCEDDCWTGRFRVINLATKEFVRLRFPPPYGADSSLLALVHDVSVERYKVVRVFYRRNGMIRTGCQILALGPGVAIWRDIGDTPVPANLLRSPVVAGGSIYWMTHQLCVDDERAASLDIRTEKFGVVVAPEGMPWGVGPLTAELGGHLCLFSQIDKEPRYMYLQILVDNSDQYRTRKGGTWKGYKIDLQGMQNFDIVEPIRMRDGKVLLASMGDKHFYVYDLDKGVMLEEPPVNLDLTKFDFITNYSETLVSPMAIRGITKEVVSSDPPRL